MLVDLTPRGLTPQNQTRLMQTYCALLCVIMLFIIYVTTGALPLDVIALFLFAALIIGIAASGLVLFTAVAILATFVLTCCITVACRSVGIDFR